MDSAVLTDILGSLVNSTSEGFGGIRANAESLFYKLLLIELILFGLGIALNRIDLQKELVAKIITIGFAQFFLFRYVWLVDSLRDGFVESGLYASGNNLLVSEFLDPSAFMDIGFSKVYEVIQSRFSDTGVWDFFVKPSLIWVFHGVVLLLMFFAFTAVGLQIFLSVAEFYLISSIAIIFIPFMVLQRTSFLGLRAINGLIATCIKLMVMAFVAGISTPVIEQLTFSQQDPTIRQSMSLAVGALAIALLMWRAPSMAMSLIAGSGGSEVGSGFISPVLKGTSLISGGASHIVGGIRGAGKAGLNKVSKAVAGGE